MIVPTVDRAKATVLVKIRLVDQDDRILPDMSARVAFLSKELSSQELKPHTVVPASAIVLNSDQTYAFRINDNTAYKTPVIIGEKWSDLIIIKEGLTNNDKVVINPPDKLRDGAHIVLSSAS
jgi:multidrug efflux pump subunit AcrA (membrane-fusion protein)